jgi:hypothetical protein
MQRVLVVALALVSWVCLSAEALARDLSFAERVKAQEAIERVAYSHRVGATRAFEAVVTREVLERKVRTYLKQSAALETVWGTAVSAEALAHELRRILRSSQAPDRLQEVFRALGGDSVLIQECFVRPVLVNRLARNFLSNDARFQASARGSIEEMRRRVRRDPGATPVPGIDRRVVNVVVRGESGPPAGRAGAPESDWDIAEGAYWHRVSRPEFERLRALAPADAGEVGGVADRPDGFDFQVLLEATGHSFRVAIYRVVKVSWDEWWRGTEGRLNDLAVKSVAQPIDPLPPQDSPSSSPSARCVEDDTWVSEGLDNPPAAGAGGVAVWTGTEMLTWGGYPRNSAARYDPLTDTWGRLSARGAPVAADAPAVWTGGEMIVWGGPDASEAGRYDPVADAWRPVSSTGAPAPSGGHALIWTGATMIVWGGFPTVAGGRYDPATDSWSSLSDAGAPGARTSFSALWSGTDMVVWGGYDGTGYVGSGGRYDPATDSWRPLAGLGAPSPRGNHTAVWTGDLMVVWGGYDGSGPLATGGRYDPRADTWTPVADAGAPSGRYQHAAVWSGSEMLVWGGLGAASLDTGGRYDPRTDHWSPTTPTNAPAPRWGPVAVWTGDLLVVWGGYGPSGVLDSGGRYDPGGDSWTPTATSNRPAARGGHSAVWTGNQMIIWGGSQDLLGPLNSGASFDPVTAAWTALSTLDAPSPRTDPVAVWTGSVMVAWGGVTGDDHRGTGGRYDPSTDSWTPTRVDGSPGWNIYRVGVSAVWTGSEMIVWGGRDSGELFRGDGARYDPVGDQWTPVAPEGAPAARAYHTAVWTGGAMVIWGGFSRPFAGPDTWFDDGSSYAPATNTWSPISRLGAATPRQNHTAVWTGRQMVVWGGDGPDGLLGDGAAYDPGSDTWEAIPTAGAPAPGAEAGLFERTVAAVWADPLMIVWGEGVPPGGNTGGRYDVTTRVWRPVTESGAPAAASGFSAVWTGGGMVVWGGGVDTGGIYQVDLSPDADGDGFTVCAGDCDDASPLVHPGAVERCNGLDDDCDGQVDEGFGVGTGCVSDVDPCHQVVGALACDADGTGTQCAGAVTLHDLAPPAILCPPAVTLECPGSTESIGQASASDACDPAPVVTRNVSGILSLGAAEVGWTATDAAGNRSSCLQSVSVVDTTAPRITAAPLPAVLWPPNHRLVEVTESVAASDECGAPAVTLTSVRSLEPDDSAGDGDGETTGDIQGVEPGTPDFDLMLRAERDGGGGGRVYEVTYSAVDASGNRADATSFVFIPHDQGGSTEPLLISVREENGGTVLSWGSIPGALSYRAVRGRVSSLRDAGSFFDLGTVSCILPSSTAIDTLGHEDTEVPPAGEAFFYVAAYDDGRDSGYGTETAPKPRIVTGGGCE